MSRDVGVLFDGVVMMGERFAKGKRISGIVARGG